MTSCGYEKCDKPLFRPPENDASYRIFNVSEGSGSFDADGKTYAANKGDVFVLRPGVAAGISSDADDRMTYCWISFRGTDAEVYLAEAGIGSDPVNKRMNVRSLLPLIQKCTDSAAAAGERVAQAEINACLLEVLSVLTPRRTVKVRMRASEQAERALRFIEANYMNGITARDVTVELNIDRTHFFRIFKARTGISPEQYIMRLRIGKAKELLSSSGATVTEIASHIGVGDVYYFSKMFKKSEGISPTEYRKMTRAPEIR